MASIPPSDDQNQRKPALIRQRPLMLKDYLRDDFLSSCSSNGFKSFPRRQCCTSVRFLLEVDLKARMKQRLLSRNRSNAAASTTISALQRASEAVIKAVKKQLPFHSGKSPSPPTRNGGSRKGLLPRSLSRKLFFKRSFCSKASHKEESENGRWRLFRDILNEQDRPSDQGAHFSTMIAAGGVSTSTTSISWAESEFSSEILRSSSCKSETSSENDVVEDKSDLPVRKVNNRVDETVGEDSCLGATTATYYGANAKEWPNEEGKEQFSPVSVLDCPFEDDEEASSSFKRNLALMEGCRKQKLMHKNRRLSETLKLEPVDLEKRIALSELNHEAPQSAIQPACSTSPQENIAFDNKEENPADRKAQELLGLIKNNSSLYETKLKGANVLLDFFRETIEEANANYARTTSGCNVFEHEVLQVAEDWLSGNPQEMLLGWEVQDGRKAYVRDMEKGGQWRILVEEEEVVALDIEVEVCTSLLDELFLDLVSS